MQGRLLIIIVVLPPVPCQLVPSQCLAQSTAMSLAVVRSWVEPGSVHHGTPMLHGLPDAIFTSVWVVRISPLNMFTLVRPICVRNRLSAFHVAFGALLKLYQCFVFAADCKKTTLGKDYTGTLSKTISGRTCQRWDSQTPHPHANTRADWFPDVTVKDAANYCRNPADWAEGPFCFTTDQEVQWEICDLPFCEGIYNSRAN